MPVDKIVLAFVGLLAFAWLLYLTQPRCPNCGSRMWNRSYFWTGLWRCGWCLGWYDPIYKRWHGVD